jgi:hypothetical protein
MTTPVLRSRPARALAILALALSVAACSDEPAPDAGATHDATGQASSAATSHDTLAPRPGAIVGTIEVDPALGLTDAQLASFDSIFILGKRSGQGMSGLVAKVRGAPFPVPFSLDADNLMGPGTMGGDWILTARLDSDGDARALQGDVEGTLEAVTAGGAPVKLVLDSVVAEAGAPIVLDGGGHGAPDQPLSMSGGDLPAGHPSLPAGHPSMGGTPVSVGDGNPHAGMGMSAPDGAEPIPGPRIKCTLLLGSQYAALDGTGVLFLMVKGTSGTKMPRAVIRVPAPHFPMAFDIGPEDVTLDVENKADMLEGELVLSARLDSDGNALSKGPGDVESETLTLQADGDAVEITLDRAVSG